MSKLSALLAELVSLLERSGFCENTQITETSFFSTEQFAFKIRTTIFSSLAFQIWMATLLNHLSKEILLPTLSMFWQN